MMLTEQPIHFPLEQDNPLNFVEHTLLTLIQVQDVYDLNEVLSALLADDVVSYLGEHRHMFSILSGTINSKIRETVFDAPDTTFPDGLLMIPPLFEQLGWDNNAKDWKVEYKRFSQKFREEPCLTYALALLFINSMTKGMESAMQNFKGDIEALQAEDLVHAERYLDNLQYFGWPAENTPPNINRK